MNKYLEMVKASGAFGGGGGGGGGGGRITPRQRAAGVRRAQGGR